MLTKLSDFQYIDNENNTKIISYFHDKNNTHIIANIWEFVWLFYFALGLLLRNKQQSTCGTL